jgi:hypothetical protein
LKRFKNQRTSGSGYLKKLESNIRWFWVFENNAESTDCLPVPVISKYLKNCQVLVL